ncbi:MAG: hypothetical protein QM733_00545 [Ilumatobacteraceae bacterium]
MTRVAVLTAGATLGFGGVAAAHSPGDDTTTTTTTAPDDTAAAAVVAAQTTVTLPLFGAPLTVDVSTDPSGQLASVEISPADGYTAVVDKPGKVAFVNADGTAKVRVEASKRGQSVSVKGATLADITGPGGWSGDPFGTGATTTVAFTVGATADGDPDITGVTSSDSTATIGETRHFSGRSRSIARASVTFSNDGQQRTLTITAMVTEREEGSHAGLSVSLSKVRGVAQDAATAAGTKTWSGMLCDGTAATVTYTVGEDGTVSDVERDARRRQREGRRQPRQHPLHHRRADHDQRPRQGRPDQGRRLPAVPLRRHRSVGEHARQHDDARPWRSGRRQGHRRRPHDRSGP